MAAPAALGIAAYRRLTDAAMPDADTGSLWGDALQMLRQADQTWSSPCEVLVEIVDEVFLPLVRAGHKRSGRA